jgi:UDP-GlcNAc3NAcA epimerase
MKALTVIGARPQFIKSAVVSRAILRHSSELNEVIVHTDQHFDKNMSDIFFHELDIPRPKYNLGVGGGSHGENTGRMIEKLEAVMLDEAPDWVIVHGDTDSTLAGALSAAKLHIPIAHVESGLRSFNKKMPEEINRIVTDHVSSMLFAPTATAVKNLRHEGFPRNIVYFVGDVMYDAALYYRDKAKKPKWFSNIKFSPGHFVLATIHRAENTENPHRLSTIFKGLVETGLNIALPVHPRTRRLLEGISLKLPPRIQLVEPVGS